MPESIALAPPPCQPVAGVWSREWEQDPLGCEEEHADRETLVLWTQTPCGLYVDLRLPQNSPGRSIPAAQAAGIQLNPSAIAGDGMSAAAREALIKKKDLLSLLLRQKSFAGLLDFKWGDTTQSGDALKKDAVLATLAADETAIIPLCTCFWRRDFDYQPSSGGLDIGVCASEAFVRETDGSLLLRETGDDASYAEGWLRRAGTDKGPFMALELLQEELGGSVTAAASRKGYWVRAGNRFAYAVGRPVVASNDDDDAAAKTNMKLSNEILSSVGKSIAEVAASWAEDESVLNFAVGSYIALAGEIVDSNNGDSSSWIIQHSTQPELVGCTLVGKLEDKDCCSELLLSKNTGVVGAEVVQRLPLSCAAVRRWKIVELHDCDLPFCSN